MTEQQAEDEPKVHRLVDIVVEEVSLVDRAANQHRFLIVKRSDMAGPNLNEGDGTNTAAQDPAAPMDGGEHSAPATPAATDGEAMRVAALAALETLTAAVELLGETQEEDTTSLAEIARELCAVAQQLADAAGIDTRKGKGKKRPEGAASGSGDDAADPGGSSNADDPEAGQDAAPARRRGAQRKVDDALKSVRELLGQVKERLASVAKSGSTSSTMATPPGVDGLAKSIAGLADAFKEQGQRIGKLEKRFGLPNSAPTAEPSRRADAEDDDASWPLNMNRPLDRENVGKDVSFHQI
jgi:hypothetical protein